MRGRAEVREAAASARGPDPERGPERTGRRQPRDREQIRERESFAGRMERALEDAGAFRCVAVRDLVDARFGGNPFAAAQALRRLECAGLLQVWRAGGPRGGSFRVVSLTERGKQRLQERHPEGAQRWWAGAVKPREASHDAAAYRAAAVEAERIRAAGGAVTRVVTDSEFKSRVARRVERARAKAGREQADAERIAVAEELGLPVVDGRIHYPDVRLEYADAQGSPGRVDVEVATGHYRRAAIAQKGAAGFVVYSVGSSAARTAQRALAGIGTDGGGGGGGGARGDEGLIEL